MKNKLPKDLMRIEKQLNAVLKPVQPRMDFVQDLRGQLDLEMAQKMKSKKVKTGLLVAGGIVGAVVMIVTVIRTIISWPSAIQSIAEKLGKREQAISA
jgi:hypothetical protein